MLTCMQVAVRKLKVGETRSSLVGQVRADCDALAVHIPEDLNAILHAAVAAGDDDPED